MCVKQSDLCRTFQFFTGYVQLYTPLLHPLHLPLLLLLLVCMYVCVCVGVCVCVLFFFWNLLKMTSLIFLFFVELDDGKFIYLYLFVLLPLLVFLFVIGDATRNQSELDDGYRRWTIYRFKLCLQNNQESLEGTVQDLICTKKKRNTIVEWLSKLSVCLFESVPSLSFFSPFLVSVEFYKEYVTLRFVIYKQSKAIFYQDK